MSEALKVSAESAETCSESERVDERAAPEPWSWSDDKLVFELLCVPQHAGIASAHERAEKRHALAPWLSAPMLATAAAQQRLARWAEGGGLTRAPESTPKLRRRIQDQAWVYGDTRVAGVVRDVLLRLPPPVVDLVLRDALIITGSPDGPQGFAGWWPFPPRGPDDEAPAIIHVLGGRATPADTARIAAHEISHTWLESRPSGKHLAPTPEPDPIARRIRVMAKRWRLSSSAVETLDLHAPSDAAARAERAAIRLGASWGYPFDARQTAVCIAGNRQRVERALGPRGLR